MYHTDFSIEITSTEMMHMALQDSTPKKYARLLLEGAEIIKQLHRERDEARVKEPKWIPVTERLPSEDCKTIVFLNRGGTLPASFTARRQTWNGPGRYATHWMPMPEPPKSDKKMHCVIRRSDGEMSPLAEPEEKEDET